MFEQKASRHTIVPDAITRFGLANGKMYVDGAHAACEPPDEVQAVLPGGEAKFYVNGRRVSREEFFQLVREGKI